MPPPSVGGARLTLAILSASCSRPSSSLRICAACSSTLSSWENETFPTFTPLQSGPVVLWCLPIRGGVASEASPTSTQRTHLAGVVEKLMLDLADAQDLLEHLVQLLLAEDELRGRAQVGARWRLLLRAPSLVLLLAAIDGIVLGHPGAEHRLLAQAFHLWQAAHATLDVLLEDLAEVAGWAAAALHHPGDPFAPQEALQGGKAGQRSGGQGRGRLDVRKRLSRGWQDWRRRGQTKIRKSRVQSRVQVWVSH